MLRLCLAILRFCLSAWVGIAIFFVVLVIDLRMSDLFTEDIKFEHPKVLFPLYYRFELSFLVPALICAVATMWNGTLGRGRRIAILQFLLLATALVAWDLARIYPRLVELMSVRTKPMPPEFQALHRLSMWLNVGMLVATAAATLLALIPTHSNSHSGEGPA
jgi:hypothetical protein